MFKRINNKQIISNETLIGNCAKRVLTNVFKMNREIKFRAWQKWHGYMFTPDYIDFINGNIIIGEHDGDSRYEDIPLMQYTGLKDKNGKEIYEGDIDNKGRVCQYFPKLGSFGFKNPKYAPVTFLGQFNDRGNYVVGNIYENPEFTQSSE